MLNILLSNLITLKYQAKNAHWNCRGILFYQFHLLFDRIYDDIEGPIDRLAEKMRGMDLAANGDINAIAESNTIPKVKSESQSGLEFCRDLLESINTVRAMNNTLMSETTDQSLLNILADTQETLDTFKYLLSSHL